MSWKSRIVLDEKILAGKPIIRGTRISIEFIVDLVAQGWSNEQILSSHTMLKKQDIEAALKYAAATLKEEKIYRLH